MIESKCSKQLSSSYAKAAREFGIVLTWKVLESWHTMISIILVFSQGDPAFFKKYLFHFSRSNPS